MYFLFLIFMIFVLLGVAGNSIEINTTYWYGWVMTAVTSPTMMTITNYKINLLKSQLYWLLTFHDCCSIPIPRGCCSFRSLPFTFQWVHQWYIWSIISICASSLIESKMRTQSYQRNSYKLYACLIITKWNCCYENSFFNLKLRFGNNIGLRKFWLLII